eukprot:TRINITY_DN5899_c0_g1_i1.p1 TRINITY_DN5899_c0_g1~~TRINITY_DN5899_c0_g1_i1.p1  ORF type:complete len:603 (-),score=51.40 TRINITY_DN5899_c0_g1_i1:91-1899(-)
MVTCAVVRVCVGVLLVFAPASAIFSIDKGTASDRELGGTGEANVLSSVLISVARKNAPPIGGSYSFLPRLGGVPAARLVKAAAVMVALICMLRICTQTDTPLATDQLVVGALPQPPPSPSAPTTNEQSLAEITKAAEISEAAESKEAMTESRSVVSSHSPSCAVLIGCVGARFLYQASYTIAILHSYNVTWQLMMEQGFTSTALIHGVSGLLLAIQHVSYVIITCLTRYRWSHYSDFALIGGFLVCSLFGTLLLCLGLCIPMDSLLCLSILFIARVVQGFGAGVEYTTYQTLTKHCSATTVSVYYAYLSGGASCGGGFGLFLVFAVDASPCFSELPVKQKFLAPFTLLLCFQLIQLALHTFFFPRKNDEMSSVGRKLEPATIPMAYRDRRAVIFTTIFFDFVRHMLRSGWEAVSVLVMIHHFGVSVRNTAMFLAFVLCFAYPALTLYAKTKWLMTEENWMHATAGVAACAIYVAVIDDDDPQHMQVFQLYFYMLGSLVFYCMILIHGSASDALGVIFADNKDPILNVPSVVFWQGMSKGFLGRLVGPVVGRIAHSDSQVSFQLLVIVVVGVIEAMTVCFVPQASFRRRVLAEEPTRVGSKST